MTEQHPTPDTLDERDLAILQFLSLIHISEPTRPYLFSYAVFCLKKNKIDSHLKTDQSLILETQQRQSA